MNSACLPHNRLEDFLEALKGFGELHGPIVNELGAAAFAPFASVSQLDLAYRRTQIPPKKYLLPFREQLLQLTDGRYSLAAVKKSHLVLFGVHPCDLEAIAYLDRVFLSDPQDPCYAARRAGIILVGISCQPDDYCFCSEAPTSASCDLFLTDTVAGLLCDALSDTGARLLKAAAGLLDPVPNAPAPPPVPSGVGIPPQDPRLAYTADPLWERFAEICVGCGACSVCCPTCYCFDVREYPGLSGDGHRLREWDNCLFKTHGEVAGGNFRPTRLERLRYRFLHKYCGFSPLQGVASCVGCGRCKEFCPVDIDLRELIPAPLPPEGDAP